MCAEIVKIPIRLQGYADCVGATLLIDATSVPFIAAGKIGIQINIFLIFPQKHVLWVLIGSASSRRFQ